MLYDLLEIGSHFWIFMFSPICLLGQMESVGVAGVLEEAGDADSRACTKSQV